MEGIGESPLVKFAQWLEIQVAIDRARVLAVIRASVVNPDREQEPENVGPEEVFPKWQPVKCPDDDCGWRGPAARAIEWGDTMRQSCPKCWKTVVKHESPKG